MKNWSTLVLKIKDVLKEMVKLG